MSLRPPSPSNASFRSSLFNYTQRIPEAPSQATGMPVDIRQDPGEANPRHSPAGDLPVDLTSIADTFIDFLQNYKESKYVEVMRNLFYHNNSYSIPIDGHEVYEFKPELYQCIINYPMQMALSMDSFLFRLAQENFDKPIVQAFNVQLFNLLPRECLSLRSMDPKEDVERLVSIKGLVIRTSELVPEMQVASFRCSACGESKRVRVGANGTIDEPHICEKCQSKYSFFVVHNECDFGDKQLIKLQENPESVPEGETPQTIVIHAFGENYDKVRPGDRVVVTGIYRAAGVKLRPQIRTLKTVYRTYIDVMHIERSSFSKLSISHGEEEILFEQEAMDKIKDVGSRREIVTDLIGAMAPSIWEHEDAKKGLLCQLFGGVDKSSIAGENARGRFRSEINILMCGDPSTAKSQLLQYVHKLAPRGVYTSGKGSSAVGLTAYISRDPDSRELILESGALVLSDRGVCCIDEFDKMDEHTRVVLHEVMEQQTVSVAKAGIVCSMNARTAICAAANPVGSRYNPRKSVFENINLSPSLMARFDLVYLMLDKGTMQNDKKLARHIVSLFTTKYAQKRKESTAMNDDDGENPEKFSLDFLAKYISYARRLKPQISEGAKEELLEAYSRLRNPSQSKTKTISATPRQLESLIRIAEALAKMELRDGSDGVTAGHVKEAKRLILAATYAAATDPVTGLIDMDMLQTGMSASTRQMREAVVELIRKCFTEAEDPGAAIRQDVVRQKVVEAVKGLPPQEYPAASDFADIDFFQMVEVLIQSGSVIKLGKGPTASIRWNGD